MSKEISKLIDEELMKELKDVGSIAIGTEDHQSAIEDICKLRKLQMDEERFEAEQSAAVSATEAKTQQDKGAKVEKIVRFAIEGGSFVASMVFYGIWLRRGFRFEENGTIRSTMHRGLTNQVFRFLKK